jgi:hypothetical protein
VTLWRDFNEKSAMYEAAAINAIDGKKLPSFSVILYYIKPYNPVITQYVTHLTFIFHSFERDLGSHWRFRVKYTSLLGSVSGLY